MHKLKIGTATLNQTPLLWEKNYENIVNAVKLAKEEGIQLLALPEMAIPGYHCEDTFFYEDVVKISQELLLRIAEHTEGIVITLGLPLIYENSVYNTVAVVGNKNILGFSAKQDLAGDGIYYEPRWFKKWQKGRTSQIKLINQKYYPIGDIVFEINGIRVAFEICEDAWNGVRPATQHYLHNTDIIINPSASNFSFGKSKTRLQLVLESSRAFKCTYLYTNLLGNDEGRIIFDGEMLIAQDGELFAYNEILSYDDYKVIPATLDIHKPRTEKRKLFNFTGNKPDTIIEYYEDGVFKKAEEPLTKPVEYKFLTKEEEFFYAETLALFDYLRKSYSKGFVVSLSGGADSSTSAILCKYAIQRAYQQLGEDKLKQKLHYWKDFDVNNIKQHLFCVYQKSDNNTENTLTSASELAKELGAEFHVWDIQNFVDEYERLVENTIKRELSWEKDDIARQNLQARVRVPALWMIANIRGALLITTSNRSESAVGYATMDGDTAGGLAPLAGIDKKFILHWLQWAHKKLNLKSLEHVLTLKPSAELRPTKFQQTDEADLMPYDILDKIERLAIHEHRGPLECFKLLSEEVPPQQALIYVKKFFTLWSRNQWKRERYAPSFHLDDANLDPKTWFRFPILNGGYKYELEILEELYKENP